MQQQIKILTESGYKYSGILIEETETYIEIEDIKEGLICIPITNISFIKKLNLKKSADES